MKKFNFNFDWQKMMAWTLDALRASGAPLMGGLGMIGLSLLCKKLDVPYQVLLDPGYVPASTRTVKAQAAPALMIMPENCIESAINAIYDNCRCQASDYYKYECSTKIMTILENAESELTDRTKSYAIMTLNNISKLVHSSYYKNEIAEKIAKLASNDI